MDKSTAFLYQKKSLNIYISKAPKFQVVLLDVQLAQRALFKLQFYRDDAFDEAGVFNFVSRELHR